MMKEVQKRSATYPAFRPATRKNTTMEAKHSNPSIVPVATVATPDAMSGDASSFFSLGSEFNAALGASVLDETASKAKELPVPRACPIITTELATLPVLLLSVAVVAPLTVVSPLVSGPSAYLDQST